LVQNDSHVIEIGYLNNPQLHRYAMWIVKVPDFYTNQPYWAAHRKLSQGNHPKKFAIENGEL